MAVVIYLPQIMGSLRLVPVFLRELFLAVGCMKSLSTILTHHFA